MKVRHTLADGMFGDKTQEELKAKAEEFLDLDSLRRAVHVSVETMNHMEKIKEV